MLAAAAVLVVGAGVGAAEKTWYVDDDGGAGINFTSIPDAVGNASEGDTIIVYGGTYREDLTVNTRLILRGIDHPVIDTNGSWRGVMISADGCVIDGFNITGSGDSGIRVYSNHNTIVNNNVYGNRYDGIKLGDSDNNTIANNSVINNSDDGIDLDDSFNNTVINNIVRMSRYNGIELDYSDNNTIANNNVINNSDDGIDIDYSFNNTLINNTVELNGYNGICFDDSDCNIIINNTVYKNGDDGIDLDDSSNNQIYYNNLVCNDEQASDDGDNNSWDLGPVIGGNYWGDHACTGNPSDGSQPYHIDADGIDHYPFADPLGGFELPLTPTMVSIDSGQDYMARQYVSSGSFSSEPSGMTYRMTLEIDARCGRFNVPRIIIYNNTPINLERTYYQVDDVSNGTGNIDVFSDHIEWYGFDESVLSEFELGIHALNTYNMTPPFSSCRTIGKEVFNGGDTVDITVSATPALPLDEIEIKTYADETDDASSEILVDTASNKDFMTFAGSTAVKWEFEDAVAGETYSTSVQAKVTPKTDSTVRYWLYTKIEAGYGEYADISSGSNQSFVQYVDTVLGTVQICFDEPVDYSLRANGKGTFYERYRAFSEVVDNGEPHTVRMWGNAYKPRVRTVPPGTTVRWTNTEQPVHTVTSDAGLWDSGNLADGQSFSYTFNILGIYGYHDALHPSMKGTVVVQTRGDLNGDDRITPTDAAIALAIAASGAHDDAADVSGDGHVTSLDALMILQAAAENMEL
jgi:parallel beta-helix repeat protein